MTTRFLASLFCTTLLATVGAAQNLLSNPGFETSLSGWTSFGPNVYAEVANPPAVHQRASS